MLKKVKLDRQIASVNEIWDFIQTNDVRGLKAAFEQKDMCNINFVVYKEKRSVVHHAVLSDKVEILEILASRSEVKLNEKDRKQRTALMYAAEFGKLHAVNLLLEKGADASCFDQDGFTALSLAALSKHYECVEAILRYKNCIPEANKMDIYQFMQDKKIIDMVKELIFETSDPYYIINFGYTLLFWGCENGSLDTVKLVVREGVADINIKKRENPFETPLQTALRTSSLDIADYLIAKGASLVIKDADLRCAYSAYKYAAEFDQSETFLERYVPEEEPILRDLFASLLWNSRFKTLKAYAEKCSTSTTKLPNGPKMLKDVAFYALKNGRNEGLECIVPYILHCKYIFHLLIKAAIYNNARIFKFIYDKVAKFNVTEAQKIMNRFWIFTNVVKEQREFAIDYMLERGFDPNEIVIGGSYLIEACRYNNLSLVQSLLKLGAKPHARDKDGFTALLLSAYNGCTSVFTEIFKIDKDLNQRSNDRLTPFLAACRSGNMQIIKALIEAGACVTDVDSKYSNCLHYFFRYRESYEHTEYLIDLIGKRDFHSLFTAPNDEGHRPIDMHTWKTDNTLKSKFLLAIPELANILGAPIGIVIQKPPKQELCLIFREDLACKNLYYQQSCIEWDKRRENCFYCRLPPYYNK